MATHGRELSCTDHAVICGLILIVFTQSQTTNDGTSSVDDNVPKRGIQRYQGAICTLEQANGRSSPSSVPAPSSHIFKNRMMALCGNLRSNLLETERCPEWDLLAVRLRIWSYRNTDGPEIIEVWITIIASQDQGKRPCLPGSSVYKLQPFEGT